MKMKFFLKNIEFIKLIRSEKLFIVREGNTLRITSDHSAPIKTNVTYKDVTFSDDSQFCLLIDCSVFVSALSNMKEDEFVNMELMDNQRIHIYNEKKKLKYRVAYEQLSFERDVFKKQFEFTLSANNLISKINAVKISASRNDTNAVRNGIHFDLNDEKKIVLASTDGVRMSMDEIEYESSVKSTIGQFTVPIEFFDMFAGFNKIEPTDKITLTVNANAIQCELQNISLMSPFLCGEFPDINPVIKNIKKDKSFEIETQQWLDALTKVNVKIGMAKKNTFKLTKDELGLSTAEEGYECDCEIPVVRTDEEMIFASNFMFLTDYIRIKTAYKTVVCYFNSPTSPLLLTCGDDTHKYIMMPLKV